MFTKVPTFVVFISSVLFSLFITCEAAVILQYHHVSDTTPKSTSISPKQFERHLQYLTDHQFNVIPLPELVSTLKNKQTLPDKTVAITFDDAYNDILLQAKPLLDKFGFPFTIFINPKLLSNNANHYLSWPQVTALAKLPNQQVTLANHGLIHDSFARKPESKTHEEWFEQQTQDLLLAEKLIEKHTGQTWRLFAYPYGEYTLELQTWLKENKFTAFTQQSGAVGLHTNLTTIPRFPASQPYDQLDSLKDKLYSLPLNISVINETINNKISETKTIARYNTISSVNFEVQTKDFYPQSLNCYVSGLGKQKIKWLSQERFSIEFSGPLPVGRVRSNCTAPSINNPERYYWFSQPWFILNTDGSWYPL